MAWQKIVLGSGTSSQYIKGDGTFGTYEAVGLGDDNTFTGDNTFSGAVKITSSSADTTLVIQTTSGTTIFPVLDFKSSHSSVGGIIKQDGDNVITFDNSQNATFAGSVTVSNQLLVNYNSTSVLGNLGNAHASGYGLKIRATDGTSSKYITTFNDKDDNVKAQILGDGSATFSGDVSTSAIYRNTRGTYEFRMYGSGTSLVIDNDASQAGNVLIKPNTDFSNGIDVTGNATFAGTVAWSGGSSANANTAYGWGDHAGAYYVNGSGVNTPWVKTSGDGSITTGSYAAEKSFAIGFTNGVANQKAQIQFTKFWGGLEISISSTYSSQNSAGIVTKRFGLGVQTGSSYANESRYSECLGVVADNFAIGEVTWDSTNSRYYIPIVHRVSTGNTVTVRCRWLGGDSNMKDYMDGMVIGSVYTTDTTAHDKPKVKFVDTEGVTFSGDIDLPTNKRIQFVDSGEYILGDGTDLKLYSDNDITFNTVGASKFAGDVNVTQSFSYGNRPLILNNGTAETGSAYDMLVINSNDAPTIRLNETGSNQELTINVGDENTNSGQIGVTGKLVFSTNRSAGAMGYTQESNTIALTLDTSQNATFAGSVNAQSGTFAGATTYGNTPILQIDGSSDEALILFDNNAGDWKMGASGTNFVLYDVTDSAIALTFDTSRNATFAGTVLGSAGTASLPTFSFSGDPNTGMYQGGASDNLQFATGGVVRAFLSATQWNVTGNGIFGGKVQVLSTDGVVFAPSTGSHSHVKVASTGDLELYSAGGDLDIPNWLRMRASAGGGTVTGAWKNDSTSKMHLGGDCTQSDYTLKIDATPLTSGSLYAVGNATFGGNVGIGTASPDVALDIHSGSIHIHTDGTNELGFGGTNHVEEWIFQYDGGGQGDLSLQSYSDAWYNVMFWDRSNQRVGIGTTAPETIFTIDQTADDNGIRIYGYDDVKTNYGEIFIDSSGYFNIDAGGDRGLELKGHAIDFYNSSGANFNHRMTWDGLFGIGTTAPARVLHVKSDDTGYVELRLEGGALGGGAVEFYSSTTALADAYADTGKNFYIRTNGTTEALKLDSSQNATFAGNVAIPEGGKILSNHGDRRIIFDEGTATGRAASWSAYGDIKFLTYSDPSYTEKVRIKADGKVGIGTASPDYALDVAGDIGVDGYIYRNGDANTYIQFAGDRVKISAGGESAFDYDESSASTLDIAKSGEADISLGGGNVFVGGSHGSYDENVGIGTATPEGKLHIYTADASIAPNADGDELVVENSGNAGISILSGNTSNGAIFFGDTQDNNVGIIDYDHNVNTMSFTTGAGANAVTIDSSQRIYTSGGIKLGSSFGEILDSYEEGSWTPAVNGSWSHSGGTTNNRYTRIGNVVHIWGHLDNLTGGSGTADLTITGLPFTVAHSAVGGDVMFKTVGFESKANNISVYVNTSEDLFFFESASNTSWTKVSTADLAGSADDIYFSLTYETDA